MENARRKQKGPNSEFWGWLQVVATVAAPLLLLAPWWVAGVLFLVALALPLWLVRA